MLQAAIMLAFQRYCLTFILEKGWNTLCLTFVCKLCKALYFKVNHPSPTQEQWKLDVFKAERTAVALSWCAYCRLHTYLAPDSSGDKTRPAAEVTVEYVFVFERLLLDTLKEVRITKHITY